MSVYGRLFARAYEPFLAGGERAGMRALRRQTLAQASGSVLEIGAGSGLNVEFYPSAAPAVLSEPDPAMRQRLNRRLSRGGAHHQVLASAADSLPIEAGTIDTVVSTLVLCTVADLPATLAEIHRVLSPGGRLLLIEHVRASEVELSRWQDRLHGPWKAFAEGCHCNRDTVAALDEAGFDTSELRPARWRRMPSIVSPLVFGPAIPQIRTP